MKPLNEETDLSSNIITSKEYSTSKFGLWISFERNEIFLLLSFFFSGIAFANYEPYASFWLSSLFQEDSFLIIGLVFAIPSTVVILGTAVFGFLADKYGIKKFVLFGVFSYMIMFLCLIFTSTSTYFLIVVLVGSSLGSAQSSNYYALATKSVNKPKEVILAKMIASISLSWVIMSPFVGWIHELLQDNAMQIQLIIAVVACLVSFSLGFFIREESKKEDEVTTKEVKVEKKPISFFPFLFIIILIVVFFFQTTGGFWAYTSIFFLDTLKVKGTFYSVFIIIKTTLAIPISILLGRLEKIKKTSWVILLFTGYQIVVFLFVMLFPSNSIMILILMGVPMYPLYSVAFYSLITRFSNEERRATAYGIMNGLGTAGYVVGILILGLIGDFYSEGIYAMLPGSLIYCVISFIAAIVFLIVQFSKKLENATNNISQKN